MNINNLKTLLGKFNIRPNKSLGQNFLLSEEVLDKIVAAAQLSKDDTVLEIGPGLGMLTERLAEKAGEVVAIEKDRKLVRALKKLLSRHKNLKIIQGDALNLFSSVIPASEPESSSDNNEMDSSAAADGNDKPRGYKVVANIPYYLTGKILQNFLSPLPRLPAPEGVADGGQANPPHQGEG